MKNAAKKTPRRRKRARKAESEWTSFRLPLPTKARLRRLAWRDKRSISGEVEWIVSKHIESAAGSGREAGGEDLSRECGS